MLCGRFERGATDGRAHKGAEAGRARSWPGSGLCFAAAVGPAGRLPCGARSGKAAAELALRRPAAALRVLATSHERRLPTLRRPMLRVRSVEHHRPDRLAALHQLEAFVDVLEL